MYDHPREPVIVIWAEYLEEFSGFIVGNWRLDTRQQSLLAFEQRVDNIVRRRKPTQLHEFSYLRTDHCSDQIGATTTIQQILRGTIAVVVIFLTSVRRLFAKTGVNW
jgi:hypothetical protein